MGSIGTGGKRAKACGALGALLACAALTAVMAAGCGKGADLGKDVLATVGGDPITVEAYRAWNEGVSDDMKERRAALYEMISIKMASKEALEKGMLGDPLVYSQVEIFYSERLPEILKKKVADEVVVTDEDLAPYRKDVKASLRVSLIAAPTLEEAQAALTGIKKGAPFEKAAGKDPAIRDYPDREVRLDDALYPAGVRAMLNGLKPGEVSPPVKMDIGYVVFKLKGRVEPEELQKAADRGLRERIKKEKLDRKMAELLDGLLRSADIKIDKRAGTDGKTEYLGAVVNGMKIKMDPKLFEAPKDPHAPHEKMNPRTLLDSMNTAINKVLLASEAKRRGLQYDPAFQRVVEVRREEILAEVYMEKEKEKVVMTPQDIKDYYEKNKAMFASPPQVRVSRILLPTREEAESALKEIKSGRDFVAVARERSTDDTTKDKGGDVGFVTPVDLKDPLKAGIGRLKAGEVTGVLKTDYGFEIIKATELKPASTPMMSELTDTISKRVVLRKRGEVLERKNRELRQKYPVKVNDELLKSLK